MEDVLSDDAAESGSFEPVSAARRRKGARTGAARERAVMAGLAVALVALVAVSLTVGTYDVSLPEMGRVLWDWLTGSSTAHDKATVVLLTIRAPRILLAALVGAALAASGAAYQGMFRNPMVSPDILGVSNGAAVGAALALLLGLPSLVVHGLSFVCGLGAVLLVMAVARAVGKGGNTLTLMILAGVVMSSTFSALLSLVKYVADPDDALPQITYWLMGSLAAVTYHQIALGAPFIIAGVVVIVALRWQLNILSLSEDEARSAGVNVTLMRAILIVASTVITASVISMCGQVGWVGLLVPHCARMLCGQNNRAVIPVSLLLGSALMIIIDTLARSLSASEIPISILTAIIGAPFFIVLLRRTGGAR